MNALWRMRRGFFEHALHGLDWIARRSGRSASLAEHLSVGLKGEEAAFFYLRRKGYTIVARRWSAGELPGDIDLIAWRGPMLCFVEVKTRTTRDRTPAEAAVDALKRRTLQRLAHRYLRRLQPPNPPFRFDVISVYLVPGNKAEVVHFENAFPGRE